MIQESKQVKVTSWAKSTQSKVTTFLDEYLINFPVKSVRQSTRNLLNSLFKKGNPLQKQKIIGLIKERINNLVYMGSSSSQFLLMISNLFQADMQNKQQQRKLIFRSILEKLVQILSECKKNANYQFFNSISNIIQFSIPFQSYLVQASGCSKCYGKSEFLYEKKDIKQLLSETKAHISTIELVLNRTYAIKDLRLSLSKKKLTYKSVSIFYINQNGQKRQLGGRYSFQQNLPNLQFNGSIIIFEFQYQKSKKQTISCTFCNNSNCPQQYCFICSTCFIKNVDIDGDFKVIAADSNKINDQLVDKYLELNQKKDQLLQIFQDITNNRKTQFPGITIVQDMESIYSYIMKNVQLLNTPAQNQSKAGQNQSKTAQNQSKKTFKDLKGIQAEQKMIFKRGCFSCSIQQIQNIIQFFALNLQYNQDKYVKVQQFSSQQYNYFLQIFKSKILLLNQSNQLKTQILQIIANLILYKNDNNQIDFNKEMQGLNNKQIAQVVLAIIKVVKRKQIKLKQTQSIKFYWDRLVQYLNSDFCINSFNDQTKVKIIAAYFLKSQLVQLLDIYYIEQDKLVDLTRLDIKQYKKLQKLSNINMQVLLTKEATNELKILLKLLPQSLVPCFSLSINDIQLLKYVNAVRPVISEQLIMSNLIYIPLPILKLNIFHTLPYLINQLALQESMLLLTQLCKYKRYWNMNIKQALRNFQQILDKQQNQKKLILSLEGYQNSKDDVYLHKIQTILVPQRMNFIIRMEVPQAEMQREERGRQGGPIQYIFLPIRDVKSQDLEGDTMRALHQWVTKQLKKMGQDLPFDLIVDKFIIDNLDLPIQVVYQKIAQKQVKKSIGKKQYDYLKVIYRMQGFFGDANESASSNPRDEKLQACLNYSSYLLTKIPQINKSGLDVIMSILSTLKKSDQSIQKRLSFFKILSIISMNPFIIKKIIQWQYADLIINSTIKFLSLDPSELKYSQILLDICFKIIREANQEMVNLRKKSFNNIRKESEVMELEGEETESQKTVKYLLEKVRQCEDKSRKDLAEKLITLIPFCSKDQSGSSKYLFQYFQLKSTPLHQLKTSKKLNWLLQFMQTLSESYMSFKIICRQNNLTSQVIKNILINIECFKKLQDKKTIKNVQILEISLALIKGLIRGDETLQRNLFAQGIIQQLFKISKLSQADLQKKNIRVGKILTLSFEIIKYIRQGRMVHPQLTDFIKGAQAGKIQKNKQRKKSKLQQMKQKNKLIAQQYKTDFLQQSQQFFCSSCRQGYLKKPQLLGIYIYSFKQQIPCLQSWWKQSKKQPGLTSVSYFTPIHYQCHMSALETDQKIQKTQWQGALVRNSDVKCNGWIAIKGPKTTDQEFEKINRKYFDKKAGNSWQVMNDLNGLFEKFSQQYNFSQETKGSSAVHNGKLALVLISAVSFYMKKSQDVKYLEIGIQFIEEHMTKRGHLLNLFFCVSLFINKYADYQKKKEKYLKLIDHLQISDFKQKKKLYVYLAISNEIYSLIHVTLKDDRKIYEYMDKFIPENFNTLVDAFQRISEKYRNLFLKWDSQEQIREYFAK